MSASDTIRKFNAVAQKNEELLKTNPYSESYKIQEFSRQDYGRPAAGSKTEARGIKAGVHVCREILYLCEIINENADGEEPNKFIKFGKLFYIYSFYSDKLVGMLIRARKYGLVHFDGEMLYQRQDDEKFVTMLMSISEIRESLRASGDPANCVSIRRSSAPGTINQPPNLPAAVEGKDETKKTMKFARSESISQSKNRFEMKNCEQQTPPTPELMKPKKSWTPKDSSKAPVFCT